MPFAISTTGVASNSITVPFAIMWDSGIFEANPENGPMARVKFKVLHENRFTLVQNLLGLWTGSPPGNVAYTGPCFYPPSPNLLCTSIESVVPLGKPFPDPTLGLPWLFRRKSIVTAVFTRPPWVPLTSGGYFSIKFGALADVWTLPGTTFVFSDGTPTNTPVGIVIGGADITVTRYRMPYIPDQFMIQLNGGVNNAPFQIGFNTYPTGTLLFLPGESSIDSDPLGNITYTVEYKFQYRSVPWNSYLHPTTGGFEPIFYGSPSSGIQPYNLVNFNILP
jgi:hypothetical protein